MKKILRGLHGLEDTIVHGELGDGLAVQQHQSLQEQAPFSTVTDSVLLTVKHTMPRRLP
jgi:hypothetical protein